MNDIYLRATSVSLAVSVSPLAIISTKSPILTMVLKFFFDFVLILSLWLFDGDMHNIM